jgi:hypothetical protein
MYLTLTFENFCPGGGVLRDVGATFFNLNDLHESLCDSSVPSVIEVDFYHAAALLHLSDAEMTAVALRALTNAEPSLASAQVAEGESVRGARARKRRARERERARERVY